MNEPALREPRGLPKVSVIIPVKNAARTLEKTFEFLLSTSYPFDKLEIILTEGGSSDATVEIIKKWQAKYSLIKFIQVPESKNAGQARDAAVKIVTGEYYLFTDGDCAPERDWISNMVEPFFIDSKIGAVGGEILTMRVDETNLVESYCQQIGFLLVSGRAGIKESGYFPEIKKWLPSEVNGSVTSPFFATANVAFSKKAFDEVKHFWDESTGEDVDFSIEVQKKGYRLYFSKEAVTKHIHRASMKSFFTQLFSYGIDHPTLIKKHACNVLEIIFQLPFKDISLRVPFLQPALIYVGSFHLMHISLAVSIVGFLFGYKNYAQISFFSSLLFAVWYFIPVFKIRPLKHFFTFAKIRYLTNWGYILGSLKGALKNKTGYIEMSWKQGRH
ncbi:MAG: hypothetical protein A3J83_08700 [Elusimicrobia bacterium RIFOXYA2_FULL_40_6]|nr:MAG: hypothetical protein A3J83_08700 [Elusimicrobia bacterium RIFOXYA2_FULL_40_6]